MKHEVFLLYILLTLSFAAPVTNLVSNADNGGSTPLETVSGLIGGLKGGVQGIVNGLTLNGGPLSAVTGVLGNLGLGSIVLNVVSMPDSTTAILN